jgi:hypothetical protein
MVGHGKLVAPLKFRSPLVHICFEIPFIRLIPYGGKMDPRLRVPSWLDRLQVRPSMPGRHHTAKPGSAKHDWKIRAVLLDSAEIFPSCFPAYDRFSAGGEEERRRGKEEARTWARNSSRLKRTERRIRKCTSRRLSD